MQWYSAIVLHSKYYQQAVAAVDAPYNMLPAAVYRESGADLLPHSKTWTPLRTADRTTYLNEVRRGVPLGGEYYLRRFPVWFDFRGNSSVLLSEAKALSTAAQIRGNIDAETWRSSRRNGSSDEILSPQALCMAKDTIGLRSTAFAPDKWSVLFPWASKPKGQPMRPTGQRKIAGPIKKCGRSRWANGSG